MSSRIKYIVLSLFFTLLHLVLSAQQNTYANNKFFDLASDSLFGTAEVLSKKAKNWSAKEQTILKGLSSAVTIPSVLYSSYFGTDEIYESIDDIAIDDKGYVYLIGGANNTNQWYLAKLKIGEKDFEFLNWYGAIGLDGSNRPRQVEVDNDGNVICVITTRDPGLPTKNAIRSNFAINPFIIDLYILKTDSNGATIFGTYFGGTKVDPSNNPLRLNGRDYFGGMVLDESNNIYITGETDGANFPTTENALHKDNQGRWDLFLLKLSPTGNLLYSSLLGGPEKDRINTGNDVKRGIAIDTAGLVYILGRTESNFAVFPNSELSIDNENSGNEFILSIFDSNSETFVYSTLLSDFRPKFLQVDGKQRVHLGGSQQWDNLVNSLANEGGQSILTFDPFEKDIVFSSYIPCQNCAIENMIIDNQDRLIFSATTINNSVFTTDSISFYNKLKRNVYIGAIDVDKPEFNFAITIGGSENDYAGGGLIVSPDNSKLYIGGITYSPDFFTTENAWSSTFPGNGDGFITILDIEESATQIELFDANPQFISLGIFGAGTVNNIRELSDETDLEDAVMEVRKAVSCDGVSEVLLRAPVSSESAFAVWELEDEKYGKLETPWASRTVEISDQHYVYAIYTPPVSLSKLTPEKNQAGILSAKIPIKFSYEHESNLVESIFNIEVVAPPVVLVHGTFDNPDNCWNTPLTADASFTLAKQLEDEGIKYWTVDYSQSNGSQESSFLLDMESSFEANLKVVYENEGGIKEAIESYRRDFNYAATKADVIGHSMGGVLPRVYAATPDYKRTENFNAGDINRLISIASTHHGSDLSYFGHFFNESWSDMELPLQQRLANTVFIYGQWLISGMAETDAVRNQLPASTELRAIGPTDIPSHAVICTISDFEDIRNDLGDQDTKQYEDLFEGLASVFYFYPGGITGFFLNLIRTYKRHPESQTPLLTGSDFPAIPNDRVSMLRRGSDINEVADQVAKVFSNQWESWQILMEDENSTWIVDEDRYVLPYEFTESNYFDTDDNSRTYISEQQYDLLSGEERQEKFDPAVDFEYRDRVIDYLRYIIFRNDLNDGVVRYQSQRGGLEEQYITHFNKNLHGYAPRYPQIINRLTSLLKGGMEDFAPDGFPPAGVRLPMEIPDPEKLDLPLPSANFKVGCEAACWSGMVPSHAEAFAKVAGEENKVILARPVNPDATPLIELNAATKGMTLKGKSSNWGPQKGYITESQKFSKIWQQYKDNPDTRKKEIADYDKKVQDLLLEDPDIATRRQLELVYVDCKTDSFYVYIKSDEPDAEQALFLATDTTATSNYYKWDINDKDGCPIDENNPENDLVSLVSLNVIANPTPELVIDGKPRYYTADYDLLAIGFYDQRLAGNQKDLCPYPTLPPFNNKTGLITPEQSALLDILNGTVKTEAMYEGGNVSHHGPENQFYVLAKPIKGSPYVDYPITAFYPETKRSKKGKIMSIPRGPAGFRDIYLKRFMAEKRREGYDLYDNVHSPGWKWRDFRPYSYGRGWADRDAPGLMDSPEEIPFPDNCNCDKSKIGIDTYQKELDLLAQPVMRGKKEEVLLFPNPTTQKINSSIISKKEETINYNILDQMGRVVGSGTVPLSIGRNDISIDVSHLSKGMYFLTFSSEGKMVSRSFIIGQ